MKMPTVVGVTVMGVALGGAALAGRDVRLQDVPAPARDTIQSQAHGARISELEVDHENGKAVYQATFRDQAGKHEIKVAPDGKLIEHEHGHEHE
jgi:hypothetical protein